MKSLTSCHANRDRVEGKTVRRDSEEPGMKSHTFCQPQHDQSGSEDSEKVPS